MSNSVLNSVPQQLATLDRAKLALAQATTVDQIKSIRDKAEAVRKYAQSAALGLEIQNTAAEVKLRAERKAGALLASLKLRGGDRKSKSPEVTLKLDDLGISKHQSARWQLEAQLSENEFDGYLRSVRTSGGEIVAVDVLRLAKKNKVVQRGAARATRSPHTNGHATNGHVKNGKPTPLGRERSSAGVVGAQQRSQSTEFMLTELENHRALLEQVLQPIISATSSQLQLGQQRAVGRLLQEMKSLLQQLSR
tara:strand:+ start:183 stop:935 length:753 start_codon:yes stop_codon:yes gene_type:complete